jgi:F-type H+-transporting ATPase subunit delta
MASRASARRYARALFDVVSKSGDPSATLAELQSFVELGETYPDLRKALLNVALPITVKAAVVRDILALQPVSPIVARFLQLIVEHDDADEFREIVSDFERRVMDLYHVVRVEVTTASPLRAEQEQALFAAIQQVAVRKVKLDLRTDPGILGGVIARVGSRVFDGSVTRHLERLRARLTAGQTL